jgi:eukaryotic-like serine/threonine-protein kinase
MGEVYKAIDTRLHRPVALKVLRSDKEPNDATTAGGVQRLLREARAAAAFNHANSVSIYELGEAEGIPYIAMEYVVGSGLRAFVGDRTVGLDVKLGWLVDVARALWAAHKAGLVHRDVKPGNIMVSEEGVVKVLDFGLAKPTKKGEPGGFQTLMGQVLGTPRYMSPEQLEGEPADARSDQFAFGVVAYELLTGVYPGGPLAGAPQQMEEIDPMIPPEVSRNVVRMMARDPGLRFPTMEHAANALRDCVPSMRNIKVPPSGDQVKRRKTTSDAPTKEQVIERQPLEQSGAVSIDVPVSKTGHTQPIPAAVGAEVARRVATAPIAQMSRPPSMKTMPLAQQSPSIPVAAPSTPRGVHSSHHASHPTGAAGHQSPISFPSGVVHLQRPSTGGADPRLSMTHSTPSAAMAPIISTPIVAMRPEPAHKKTSAWTVVAILIVLLAIAGGAVLALMHR